MISKDRKRHSKISDAKCASHALFHLIQSDFPGLSFESATAGKLRLDQNDGINLPNANLNAGHGNGIDADTVDGMHASELSGGGGGMIYTEGIETDVTVTLGGSTTTEIVMSPNVTNLLLGFVKVVGAGDVYNGSVKFDVEIYEDSALTKCVFQVKAITTVGIPRGLIDNPNSVLKLDTANTLYVKIYNRGMIDDVSADFDIVIRGIVLS